MGYFELFFSFMKIGFTSFGGMSMIPLILEEMQAHHWMSAQELADLVAIAEMTPGPLGINCATFEGTQAAGISGGLAAVADLFGMGIGALMFVLLTRRKWSVPKVIAASAACGILVYGLPVREWLCIQSIFP